ncbi:MAG: arginase family protein [Bacteroidales bacterium]|nr:arginase family protein [Bacteroidales bacterium]
MEENIATYFAPLDLDALEYNLPPDDNRHIGGNLRLHTEKNGFPDLDAVRVALIGVPEERNAYNNVGCSLAPDEIRKAFYRLYRMEDMPATADLGNFRIGKETNDTYHALSETLAFLIRKRIVPVILGGSQDLTYANYLAYEQLQEVVNITAIDPKFNIGNKLSENSSEAFVHRIILRQPNYLFNYSNLGYQSYFVSPDDVALMEKLRFDATRLGVLQEDIRQCEPILRDSSIVSIDMAAVRFSDAPGCRQVSPNGLNGKEICTLARYAGAAGRVTSFGIYEYNPSCDIAGQSALLIAEMLWYFLEGFSIRSNEQPDILQENCIKYIVELQQRLYQINFYESKTSGLWWMEVPYADKKAKFERMYLIPCTRKDYETACQGELPERWLSTYQKLEKK